MKKNPEIFEYLLRLAGFRKEQVKKGTTGVTGIDAGVL